MLKLAKETLEIIYAHAEGELPIEACGYLSETDGVVQDLYKLNNLDKSAEHYSMDPKEQFDTIRTIREKGQQVKAVYHSHPETPARPSEEDIKLAYDPTISYVIVSLADGKKDIKSFKIKNGQVEPEPIEIV